MKKFDTRVQEIKYKTLREVARHAWKGDLQEYIPLIPEIIMPGKIPTMRCCVYKERAIVLERIRLAMSRGKSEQNVIQVIDIACDECPASGYEVTESCRGCLSHRCTEVCPRNAISHDEKLKAHIDKTKCVNCGKCASVCPYSAIINRKRPCETGCKEKAISAGPDGSAQINVEKCISCGTCVYQCPFGAVTDKSFILDVIDILQQSDSGKRYPVYAIVAPSIASQFSYAKIGQVVHAIKQLGFTQINEVALGADMVAYEECGELAERGFLMSSCCPAFVSFVEMNYPEMASSISSSLSPMAMIAKRIKENDEKAKVVFIGPCTAKKKEIQRPSVSKWVDSVITFEELQALFDSRDFDISAFPEDDLDEASYFGRIFARSGGLSDAVAQALKERGFADFDLKAARCDGIDACRMAVLKASKGKIEENFIEGMACIGGCINGAGCLTHGEKNKNEVDEYGRKSPKESIVSAIDSFGKN